MTEKVLIQTIIAISAGISGLFLLATKVIEYFTKSDNQNRNQIEKIVLEREKNLMDLTEAVVKTTQKFQVVLDKFIENSCGEFDGIKDDLKEIKEEVESIDNRLDKFCDKMEYIMTKERK